MKALPSQRLSPNTRIFSLKCIKIHLKSIPLCSDSASTHSPAGADTRLRPVCPRRNMNRTIHASSTVSAAAASESGNRKAGVLFVCLGNICRSPTAEAVFRSVVEKAGLTAAFDIDSCGTGGGNPDWFTEGGWSYHEGDPADSRMTMTARKRGVLLTSRSRPLQPLDLSRFDYIVGMDPKNLRAIKTAADYWLVRPMGEGKVPPDYSRRVVLMTSYCRKFTGAPEVPDPYYGGAAGFERVLDLLEDACEGLLESIRKERGL
ncbi:hypothetical protein Vretimale_11519 [Volvox reticuliferus]|uniref:Phosphotyrosine protein phosphatase I domain-containing protein n=1 Tax=Volvox reticuliferus TaxID=1737510 RepID=A0A8J4GHR6_9CHLO|nr:hypothetical protein Vretifemale_14864 [Volvox reticuliferus]GIM07426.1 hypothetical protein Vretimale_11519 [Volvox reticuliferus]